MNLTLELSGLNLERLLRAAGVCGVRMKNVRRMDERTMRVVVPAAQKKRMARSAKNTAGRWRKFGRAGC